MINDIIQQNISISSIQITFDKLLQYKHTDDFFIQWLQKFPETFIYRRFLILKHLNHKLLLVCILLLFLL